MSLELYQEALNRGILHGANVLYGTAEPGGDSGVQDSASIGSVYIQLDVDGNIVSTFIKTSDNNIPADWELTAYGGGIGGGGSSVNRFINASASGITTLTTVESVKIENVSSIQWWVTVVDEADSSNKQVFSIFATHEKPSVGDAVGVKISQFQILKTGSPIAGLSPSVSLIGTGVTQAMCLNIEASTAVSVKTTRVAFS